MDYRDRWRFDSNGIRLLTLRRLLVLLDHLPPGAATVRATGGSGWSLTDYLVSDVYHALAQTPHPSRPVVNAPSDPDRDKRVAAFKARAAERQRAIDAGEIT